MALELSDLRYFLEVKAQGTLTGAARALGITQPSLTAAMQRLERHFGTMLLLRDHTGVRLTVTGHALAFDAEELFEVLSRAERRVTGLEDAETGRFTIGCHESLGAYFLPNFLREIFETRPGIEISIHNAPSAAVRDAVVERAVDFGVVVNPKPHPDLVLVELFDDAVDFFTKAPSRSFSIDGHSDAFAAADLPSAYARISQGPLVHASRVSESRALMSTLEEAGCVVSRRIACGDFELVKSIALAGVGVALLPRRVASYNHEGKLLRLHPDLPAFQDRIYLLYRADMHKTRAAQAVKDTLLVHGKRLRDPSPDEPQPKSRRGRGASPTKPNDKAPKSQRSRAHH
ncbi:MAG: LysR family transcriptional regulator [Polyangiaceae bacterium]